MAVVDKEEMCKQLRLRKYGLRHESIGAQTRSSCDFGVCTPR